MAAAATHNANAVSPETLITIKVSVNDNLKKLKLPLKDLGATTLPLKVCVTQGCHHPLHLPFHHQQLY